MPPSKSCTANVHAQVQVMLEKNPRKENDSEYGGGGGVWRAWVMKRIWRKMCENRKIKCGHVLGVTINFIKCTNQLHHVCLQEVSKSEAKHYVILFRDAGCQFRAIYEYYPEREDIFKLTGNGPKQLHNKMMDRFYKYVFFSKKLFRCTVLKCEIF